MQSRISAGRIATPDDPGSRCVACGRTRGTSINLIRQDQKSAKNPQRCFRCTNKNVPRGTSPISLEHGDYDIHIIAKVGYLVGDLLRELARVRKDEDLRHVALG